MARRLILITMLATMTVACEGSYRPPEPGLIDNPRFVERENGKGIKGPWIATLHGGEPSIRFTSANGILTVEKFGPEPWGQLTQPISPGQLKGRTAEFSVELAGELESRQDGRINPWQDQTGLSVLVKGYPAGRTAPMMGKKILVNAHSEPGMSPGTHDWQRYSLRFEVPEGATDIQVAIRMTRYGILKARGPSLVALE